MVVTSNNSMLGVPLFHVHSTIVSIAMYIYDTTHCNSIRSG